MTSHVNPADPEGPPVWDGPPPIDPPDLVPGEDVHLAPRAGAEDALPWSEDAEFGLAYGLMVSPQLVPTVAELVEPADFFSTLLRAVFAEVLSCDEEQVEIGPLVIHERLKARGVEADDPRRVVTRILDDTGYANELPVLATRIADLAERRRGIQAAWSIEAAYRDEVAGMEAVRNQAEMTLQRTRTKDAESAVTLAPELVIRALARPESGTVGYLPTGIIGLDAVLGGGLPIGEPTVLGGRPKMGKSSFAFGNVVLSGLDQDLRVAVFSAEMNEIKVAWRLISAKTALGFGSGVPYSQIRAFVERGEDIGPNAGRVTDAANWLGQRHLAVDDTSAPTPEQIRRRCRVLAARWGGLDLVVVDYFQQLNHGRQRGERTDLAQRRTSDVLREVAKDLSCAVLILTQLNKSVDSRDNKRPTANDVRECDALVEHAGLVLGAYRDFVYSKNQHDADSAEIIVMAVRESEVGTVPCGWDGACFRYENQHNHGGMR